MADSTQHFLADYLSLAARAHARSAVSRQLAAAPRFEAQYEGLVEDTLLRIEVMAEALAVDCVGLFVDHIAWTREAHAARGVEAGLLVSNLEAMRDLFAEELPTDLRAAAAAVMDRALAAATAEEGLPAEPSHTPSAEAAPVSRDYLDAVLAGDWDRALDVCRVAMDDHGLAPSTLVDEVVLPIQVELGKRWQQGRVTVADEHFCTQVALAALAEARARSGSGTDCGKRLLATTVTGDLHQVGLTAVVDRFRSAGWTIDMLGADVPLLDLLSRANRIRPDLIAVAVTIPTAIRAVQKLIAAIRTHEALADVPVLVGGGVFSRFPELATKIGADLHGMGPDDALRVATARLENGASP